MTLQRGRVAGVAAEAVAAFMEAVVSTAGEASVAVDFMVAGSAAVECGWAEGDLSAPDRATPVHFQGRPLEAAAEPTHIADMRAVVRA